MDSEIKPKADVRGVELTEYAKFTVENIVELLKLIFKKDLNLNELVEFFEVIMNENIFKEITALQSAHDVEVKELKNRIELAEEALWDMWEQHAYTGKSKGKDIIYTGGLSANESCEGYFLRYNLIDENGFKITQSVRDAFKDNK